MPNEYVIITAGGTGSRMGGEIPKQFLELKSVPVIMHSIKAFYEYSSDIKIIVVLPESQVEAWESLCRKHQFNIIHDVCTGGKTRFESVKNGMAYVDKGWVAVHDAVRPLVSRELIARCFDNARQKGNAVPAIPLTDSVREVSNDDNRQVFRERFRLVQTPQVFDSSMLQKAYGQAFRNSFTDDASVVEAFGTTIYLVDGEKRNIKITNPEDLLLAEALLKT